MPEPAKRRVALLSRTWWTDDERAFVLRAVAGAASRFSTIEIVAPGAPGEERADGAFTVRNIGWPTDTGWPDHDVVRWPHQSFDIALTDADDPAAINLLAHVAPDLPLVVVTSGSAPNPEGVTLALAVGWPGTGAPERPTCQVGLHIPVNPIAANGRHNALGFSDYLLVLSDRSSRVSSGPSPMAAWLCAGAPDDRVVVIEDARATVVWGRSRRGEFGVDSRTDLWRLMAHARFTVDLAPGLVARECIESVRFGTPVLVPQGSAGQAVAAGGGGLWFADAAELFGCNDALADRTLRDELGARGRENTDAAYGDPHTFQARVREAFATSGLLE